MVPTSCARPGDRVYSRAVRRGRVPRAEAEPVPCLLELALLHPDPDDMDWLVPTSPQEVMTRLLRGVYDEVTQSQRRMGSAVAAFDWYAGLGRQLPDLAPQGEGTAIRVLDGLTRIQAAMDEATEACATEVLTVQPGGIRREAELTEGLHRALELRGRGRADARPVHPCRPARTGVAQLPGADGRRGGGPHAWTRSSTGSSSSTAPSPSSPPTPTAPWPWSCATRRWWSTW